MKTKKETFSSFFMEKREKITQNYKSNPHLKAFNHH